MSAVICRAADEAEVRLRCAPSPDIENGIGPVRFAEGVRSVDGRIAWVHPWSEVDSAWFEIRLESLSGAAVLGQLPGDFVAVAE